MNLKLEKPISMELQKNGRTYISPQVIFVRATAKEKCLEISFPFLQLQTIIDALLKIKNENEEYFDDL